MLVIAQARTSLGSSNPGTELGPEAILLNSLLAGLSHNKITYKLLDPVESTLASGTSYRSLKNFSEVTEFNKLLYRQLAQQVSSHDTMLTLGGDHSIGIGSMSAAKKLWPESKVIYVDAHPDCHPTPEHTTSGNIHGLPVSTVLGDGLAQYFDFPHFTYQEIAMIGLKDIDRDEKDYLVEHAILYITIDDIIADGIGPAVAKLIKWASGADIHVALDIDSIDVSEAPGTGIINKGGLSYREISYLTRQLAQLTIRSIDVVEVNPARDNNNQTIHLAAELILNLLGSDWTTYTRYLSTQ